MKTLLSLLCCLCLPLTTMAFTIDGAPGTGSKVMPSGLAVVVPAAAHAGVGSGTSPASLFNSRAPATPANMAPAADAISQPLCPALASTAFSDPFDTQTASQWQIATNTDFTSLVYDSGLTTNLLILNPEP